MHGFPNKRQRDDNKKLKESNNQPIKFTKLFFIKVLSRALGASFLSFTFPLGPQKLKKEKQQKAKEKKF